MKSKDSEEETRGNSSKNNASTKSQSLSPIEEKKAKPNVSKDEEKTYNDKSNVFKSTNTRQNLTNTIEEKEELVFSINLKENIDGACEGKKNTVIQLKEHDQVIDLKINSNVKKNESTESQGLPETIDCSLKASNKVKIEERMIVEGTKCIINKDLRHIVNHITGITKNKANTFQAKIVLLYAILQANKRTQGNKDLNLLPYYLFMDDHRISNIFMFYFLLLVKNINNNNKRITHFRDCVLTATNPKCISPKDCEAKKRVCREKLVALDALIDPKMHKQTFLALLSGFYARYNFKSILTYVTYIMIYQNLWRCTNAKNVNQTNAEVKIRIKRSFDENALLSAGANTENIKKDYKKPKIAQKDESLQNKNISEWADRCNKFDFSKIMAIANCFTSRNILNNNLKESNDTQKPLQRSEYQASKGENTNNENINGDAHTDKSDLTNDRNIVIDTNVPSEVSNLITAYEVHSIPLKSKGCEDIASNETEHNVIVLDCSSDLSESSSVEPNDDLSEDIEYLLSQKTRFYSDLKKFLYFQLKKHVVQKMYVYKIYSADLKTLAPHKWLNDKIINLYLKILFSNSENNKFYLMTTYFYPQLSKRGYDSVKTWTKDINIFSYKFLIIPVFVPGHWILGVVDTEDCSVTIYDSLHFNRKCVAKTIKEWVEYEYINKYGSIKEFSCYTPTNIPRQLNGDDCGVFVLYFAKKYHEGKEICKDHVQHVNTYRLRVQIMHEICVGKILYETDEKMRK